MDTTITNNILKQDAFAVFGYINPTFSLDLTELNAKLRTLQKQYHPDTTADVTKRPLTERISARINTAYATLQDPLSRAQLILTLVDYKLDLNKDTLLPQDFLATQLDLHEQLDTAKSTKNHDALNDLLTTITKQQQVVLQDLAQKFHNKNYVDAQMLTKQLAFYSHFLHHINDAIYQIDIF